MKKFLSLRFIGFVVILVFVLSLIVFNFAQSQVEVQKGKPPGKGKGKGKPPAYVWSVVIVDGNFALQGGEGVPDYTVDTVTSGPVSGKLYDSSQTNIISRMRVTESQDQYRTSAVFELYYPDDTQGEVLYQVDFTEDMQIYGADWNEEKPFHYIDPILNSHLFVDGVFQYKRCRFPVCGDPLIDCYSPFCMFHFLQEWDHPHPGYEKFHIHVWTDFSYDITEGDFTQWDPGDPKKIWLAIEIWPLGLEGTYSPSEFNGIGVDPDDYNWQDYGYIERIESTNADTTDIWRVVWGANVESSNLTFSDNYREYIFKQVKKNKIKREVMTGLKPTYGEGDMHFEILFIRTKK